ncbi:MAG: hypothetical protein DLM60_07720 [Pseudonocardiales bacterium]|nr:DUF5753 domain-containing protein [Actinomycetota bacterium]PZS21075.1 MAG: hypothetical protein DLM60_07720 [Pseudonocardiales bacterium]
MLLLGSEALSAIAQGPASRRDQVRALIAEMRRRDLPIATGAAVLAEVMRGRAADAGVFAGLRWHVGSPQIMAAQLEHLIKASHRSNLRLGIIPWTTPVYSPALHCFTIFDDRAVIVDTETATAIITDPADIADYDRRHTFYAQYAVVGDPVRALLTRLAGEYNALA